MPFTSDTDLTSPEQLVEVHNICQLKYRYMRAIDTLDWAVMERCFAEDAEVWYQGGEIRRSGRAAILDFFRAGLTETHISSHIALHPEIALTSETTAEGIWRFQDMVFSGVEAGAAGKAHGVQPGQRVDGVGIYHDAYRKVEGRWLIQSTGFVRLYEYWATPGYPLGDAATAERGHVLKFWPERGGTRS